MAKQKRAASTTPTRANLAKQIARLDREILMALNERAKLTRQWDTGNADGEVSLEARVAWDSDAVKSIVEKNRGPLDAPSVGAIFRTLTGASRSLSQKTRVVFLGPEYTYSHLASLKYFGEGCELVSVATIPTVFEEIVRSQADFGVVPLENSTDGRVSDTLDMFLRAQVKICGEIKLKIEHCLLANCSRNEIKKVYSKPQAMSQCRGWLAQHLSQAETISASSTVVAAKEAIESPGCAAIASREAAERYGLNVVDAAIQDHPNNVTRFAVIGRFPSKKTGQDKTAFLFGIPHEPGSLADIMAVFKRNRLNMTWIESYPDPDMAEAYLFFVETQGHQTDLKVKQAIAALEKKTDRLEVLGSYPQAESDAV